MVGSGAAQNPTVADDFIYWSWLPEPLREPMRHAAFCLINYPLTMGFVF
ncbi:hypothetical protein [Streptomyces sp. NRRL F-2664]|nr:hypothetical protein [Streptomyces sp. NRRL F-2664]